MGRKFMKYFCLLLFLSITLSCRQSLNADILIENVNIIDIETGAVIAGQDVMIIENRITTIAVHGKNEVQAKTVIDGTGKYLIPGLWDMHVHMMRKEWYRSQMPLLRANGITGFREMWGDLKIAGYVRSQMEKDSLPYFRFTASGHIMDGKIPYWNNSIPIATPDAAVRIVDSLISDQSDFIKIYSFLEPAIFEAIAKKCKERNFSFAGHVPHTVWLTKASDAGMASMEHLYGFLTEACSNSDSAMSLMKQWVSAFEKGDKDERNRINLVFYSLILNNFSREKLKNIAQHLKKNNTYIVPTLVTLRGEYFMNDTSFTNDRRLKYLSKETLDYWKEETDNFIRRYSALEWQNKRRRWEIERQI